MKIDPCKTPKNQMKTIYIFLKGSSLYHILFNNNTDMVFKFLLF